MWPSVDDHHSLKSLPHPASSTHSETSFSLRIPSPPQLPTTRAHEPFTPTSTPALPSITLQRKSPTTRRSGHGLTSPPSRASRDTTASQTGSGAVTDVGSRVGPPNLSLRPTTRVLPLPRAVLSARPASTTSDESRSRPRSLHQSPQLAPSVADSTGCSGGAPRAPSHSPRRRLRPLTRSSRRHPKRPRRQLSLATRPADLIAASLL